MLKENTKATKQNQENDIHEQNENINKEIGTIKKNQRFWY